MYGRPQYYDQSGYSSFSYNDSYNQRNDSYNREDSYNNRSDSYDRRRDDSYASNDSYDRRDNYPRKNARDQNTVWIGGLPPTVDDASVYDVFRPLGRIKEIRWLHDQRTDKFKGCGYVTFHESGLVEEAVKLNGTYVHGAPMVVDYPRTGH